VAWRGSSASVTVDERRMSRDRNELLLHVGCVHDSIDGPSLFKPDVSTPWSLVRGVRGGGRTRTTHERCLCGCQRAGATPSSLQNSRYVTATKLLVRGICAVPRPPAPSECSAQWRRERGRGEGTWHRATILQQHTEMQTHCSFRKERALFASPAPAPALGRGEVFIKESVCMTAIS